VRSRRTRWLRRGAFTLVGLGLLAGVTVLGSVGWVRATASGHTFADVDLSDLALSRDLRGKGAGTTA